MQYTMRCMLLFCCLIALSFTACFSSGNDNSSPTGKSGIGSDAIGSAVWKDGTLDMSAHCATLRKLTAEDGRIDG